MKKALIFAGLAAATLSFVGCNKEADVAVKGTPFEIVLNTVDTRTVNDGMNTKWKENDALSVFYAPAGGEEWSANTKFTVTDTESGLAKGEVSLTAESNDWYLFYPYTAQIPNPKSLNADGTHGGYVYIGSGSNSSQKQAGLNSTAHLAGGDLPMFGVQKNVAASETPSVPMKHLTTVARVNVTNATTEAVTITAVSFTAPENVVGTYYIDFSGTEPVITDSDDTHVGKTARLEVKDAEALAPGATASFYIAMKPFSAPAGSTLKVQVYAGAEVSESELTLTNAVDFQANHIKKINVDYAPAAVAGKTLAEALELADGTDVTLAPLTVGAVSTKGYVVTDGTDGLYVYVNATPSVKVGDQVKVTGKMASYYGVRQVSGPSQTVVTEGDGTFEASWTDITANFESYTNTSSAPVKYEATVVKNGTYTNFKVEGADTFVGTLTNAPSKMFEGINEGDKVVVYGYFSTINTSSKLVGVYAYKLDVVSSGAPAFNAELPGADETLSLTVPATTTSLTINVTGNVAWTAVASEGATVAPASGEGAGAVTVSFPANSDPANTKEYSVTVSTTDEAIIAADLNDEFVFNITQEAFDASDLSFEWDLSTDSYNKPTSEDQVVWSADAARMQADKAGAGTAANNYLGGDANKRTSSRFYTNSKLTITPANGVTIKYVEFTATSDSYATAFQGSTWTNATAAVSANNSKLVTVTPTDGTKAISAVIGGTCGFTLVKVYYSGTPSGFPESATLASIAVSGQKTAFNVGETFTHDTAVVTATYSDNTTKNVTSSATFSQPDMSTAGTKTVTVSYTEGTVTETTTYDITVSAGGSASTVAAVLAGGPGTYSVEGLLVYAVSGANAIVGDATGKMLLYLSNHGLAVGDVVDAANVTVKEYNGVLELTSGTYNKKSSGNPVDHGTPTSLDDATAASAVFGTFSAAGFHSAQFVTITGMQSGRYIENDNAKLYMNVANATNDGHQVVSTGYVYSYSTNYANYNYQVVTIEKSADEQYCLVSPDVLNVAATATSATLTIQANAAWTVTSDNSAFTVSPASGNADATVTISFSANETQVARVANITVSCTAASVSKKIVLTQAAKSTGDSVTDVLDQNLFGISGKNYTEFSGKAGESGAIYAGQCAADYGSIQLRSNNSNSGVITTASGGKVTKIVVTWNSNTVSGRTLNIYGKNSAYSAATDLYNSSNQGTLLGTVVCGTSTELIVTGDYEFLGFRSASGAMYLDKVEVTWE